MIRFNRFYFIKKTRYRNAFFQNHQISLKYKNNKKEFKYFMVILLFYEKNRRTFSKASHYRDNQETHEHLEEKNKI